MCFVYFRQLWNTHPNYYEFTIILPYIYNEFKIPFLKNCWKYATSGSVVFGPIVGQRDTRCP